VSILNGCQFHPKNTPISHFLTHSSFPDAGHLIHMPTHIDVLVGDYESCVEYNHHAILADLKIMRRSPDTAGTESFYFGYIVHGFHMLIYGAILGGMESIAMEKARQLNQFLTEDLFINNSDLAIYLESYAALDIHIMVRFGRWKEILQVSFPRYPLLMLFRSASLHYARGLALANTGEIDQAITEADLYDELRLNPSVENRILHNNKVSALLAVDAPMLRGEIAYFTGKHDEAFELLRGAVKLQDGLNYDEPWGKMQPLRHPLGGLLCDQGRFKEAEEVFREDLKFHPKNPWGLAGLIICLNGQLKLAQGSCCSKSFEDEITIAGRDIKDILSEVQRLKHVLAEQRKSKYADSFEITAPCACCRKML
jgi:tetratricopeptide (TPR) repeat protein